MATGRFISYLRVSTAKQGASGLGIEAQRAAVESYLNGGRWTLTAEIVEIESGKKSDRPALSKALAMCRLHNAVLIVAKLDRLSRNVAFLSALMESGVEFVACDFPNANKLTLHIMASVAENEAAMISKRTKDALTAAKARGVVLGGDRGGVIARQAVKGAKISAEKRTATAKRRAADLAPVILAIQADGAASLRQIAAVLNDRGILTSRGGHWSASQVLRAIRYSIPTVE
jgi:DNA invertase Pin-like site-specific DNA recombinase